MRTFTIASLFALAVTHSCLAQDKFVGIDDAVNASIKKGEIPGAVVLVVQRDKVVCRKAYGDKAKMPEASAMTADTVFDLASLTKPIVTAILIMLFGEDGKLNVNDPIAKHLPGFSRKETEGITIAQLLTHTGG